MRKLERSLDLPAVIAFAIGAMLGGEIFVLPAIASGLTGPSLWLAFVAAAALVMPAALSKSELATAIPGSGGSYLYIERCLGPYGGTIAGIGLWLSLMLKCAFAMGVLSTYLELLVDVPGRHVATVLVIGLTGLNILGIRKVGRFQSVIVTACTICLVGMALVGQAQVTIEHAAHPTSLLFGPQPFFTHGMGGFLEAVGLVFVSYAGVTKVTAIAEEVKNESRNIPLGILVSLIFMCFLYAGVSWVLVWNFDPQALQNDPAPVATLARKLLGSTGETIINIAAVAALISMSNAGLLAASRFPFAMSRDRLLPATFQTISPRYLSPVTSILITGASIVAAMQFFDVDKIVKLASVFMIAAFMAVNLSLLVLRESGVQWYKPRFRSPAYPYVQIFGILTGFALLWAMGTITVLAISAATVIGTGVFLVYGRPYAKRFGVLRQLMDRKDILANTSPERDIETNDKDTSEVPAAHTVIPLFGSEVSPEALVHLGLTLAQKEDLEILRILDNPEATVLDVDLLEDDRVASLKRRILGLASERKIKTHFHTLESHDIRKTLFEYANRAKSQWFVMAWRERGIIIRNPYEWLYTNLRCNVALFKDAGIRTYRQVLAVIEPGPHDALIVRTADELSQLFRAKLTLAQVLPKAATGKNEAGHRANAAQYLEQMQRLCRGECGIEIIESDKWLGATVKASASFDMLVFGAPPDRPLHSTFFPAKEDRLMDEAHCAVLRLKTPRTEMHRAVSTAPTEETFDLKALLDPRACVASLNVTRKDQLFAEIGRHFSTLTNLDASDITNSFDEREQQQNTAMGDGIAMPHGTIEGLEHTKLAVFVLKSPIDYGSADAKVDVCVSTLGPPTDREAHLRVIASMARLLVKTDLLSQLRMAQHPDDIHNAIIECFETANSETETTPLR